MLVRYVRERLLERALGVRPDVVDARAFELAQAVIDARIHVHDVEVFLDELDRGQKLVALQTVQVERVRFEVGRGDENHALLEERFEQSPHQHGIGDVGDVKFVEAEKPCIARDVACDRGERVGLALLLVQRVVNLLHEAVKVDAPLASDRGAGVEAVEQEALAAADAAPQVEAAHDTLTREQADERRFEALEADQVAVEPLEMLDARAPGPRRA